MCKEKKEDLIKTVIKILLSGFKFLNIIKSNFTVLSKNILKN